MWTGGGYWKESRKGRLTETERKREREGEGKGEREREREREAGWQVHLFFSTWPAFGEPPSPRRSHHHGDTLRLINSTCEQFITVK